MARQFQMPESLDIGYKFFNGKWTMKELAFRLLGVPPALVVGALMYGVTESRLLTAISAGVILIFGLWLGSKKVFDKTIPLLTAMQYAREMDRKSKVLYNYRDYEGTTPATNKTQEVKAGGKGH